jgi:hypothetical protein
MSRYAQLRPFGDVPLLTVVVTPAPRPAAHGKSTAVGGRG